MRRFLHYFRSLTQSEAELLKSAIAKRASGFFVPMGHPIDHTNAESVALEQKARALAQMADWQFTSLKLLKMAAGMSRSEHPVMKRQMSGFQMPEDVLRWLDGLATCKATELRKLVKQAFASRFGFAAENLGGGGDVPRAAASAALPWAIIVQPLREPGGARPRRIRSLEPTPGSARGLTGSRGLFFVT